MFPSWKNICLNISQRWIFVIMAFLSICLCNALRVIISITITEMVVTVKKNITHNDQTCPSFEIESSKNHTLSSYPIYDWDEYTQGMILSSYFWGYAALQFPMGTISERFGGKYVMGLGILIPSVLTFVTPLCIKWGDSTALIVVRIIIGMASASVYPATSNLISKWSTPTERTFFGSFIYAGGIVGVVIGTTLPAIIIKYLPGGWPAVFHYFGVIGGVLWFPLWSLLCYNSPDKHPFISEQELNYLDQNKDKKKCKKNPPWRHILMSKPFWAFAIGLLGTDWTYYTLTNDLPKYMSQVVKFSLENNGYLSALPYLSMYISILVCSWLVDKMLSRKLLTKTNARKIFATISLIGPAVFIMGASYSVCDKFLVVSMLVIGMAFMGCAYTSLLINPLDLSPNYSGTLMAVGNGLAAVGGIFAPYIVGILTPNQTIEEWRRVFYIVLGVAFATSAYILLYTSAEVQEWDDPDFDKKTKKCVHSIDQPDLKKTAV